MTRTRAAAEAPIAVLLSLASVAKVNERLRKSATNVSLSLDCGPDETRSEMPMVVMGTWPPPSGVCGKNYVGS